MFLTPYQYASLMTLWTWNAMIPILSIIVSFAKNHFKIEIVYMFYHVSTYFTEVALIRGKQEGSQETSIQSAPHATKLEWRHCQNRKILASTTTPRCHHGGSSDWTTSYRVVAVKANFEVPFYLIVFVFHFHVIGLGTGSMLMFLLGLNVVLSPREMVRFCICTNIHQQLFPYFDSFEVKNCDNLAPRINVTYTKLRVSAFER